MTKAQQKQQDRDHARVQLRALCPVGATIYTKAVHVSRSGMYRAINVYVMQDNAPIRISEMVAKAIEGRYDHRHEAVGVSGCGMDMGFAIVYALSHALYGAGFGCIGQGCPSSDHVNGDRDYTPHYDGTPRTSEEVDKDLVPYRHYHKSGGYALQHQWL